MRSKEVQILSAFLIAGALASCSTPKEGTNSDQDNLNTGPKTTSFDLIESGSKAGTANIVYDTEAPVVVNPVTFENVINTLSQIGGKPPKTLRIVLSDELPDKPDVYAGSDINMDITYINVKKIVTEMSVGSSYTSEALISGGIVAELCNQTLSEGNVELPQEIQLEHLCDSLGIMTAAISSGKSYEEYKHDIENNIAYKEGIKYVSFDLPAFNEFSKALVTPLITIEGK